MAHFSGNPGLSGLDALAWPGIPSILNDILSNYVDV
jgi:hypothetical protein